MDPFDTKLSCVPRQMLNRLAGAIIAELSQKLDCIEFYCFCEHPEDDTVALVEVRRCGRVAYRSVMAFYILESGPESNFGGIAYMMANGFIDDFEEDEKTHECEIEE